ncbi:MAG: LacI family transcriptional regulator [Alphaproteobacteria bacterium]|nr:LacI family transcriptional regulator [Alphaproteobacteria bacterium]
MLKHQNNITLKEVAKLAGVSPSAVSRTFTEGASVSSKTRKRVQDAARELNYLPNFLASSLITKRTKLIALISDNYSNPIFLEVFDLFTKTLQERGFRPLLYNYSHNADIDDTISMLRQYNVDAVIVASSVITETFVKRLQQMDCPIVHAFSHHDNDSDVNSVSADNVQGGRLAAKALLAKKYRDILFLGGPEHASSTISRLKGFTEILQANNVSLKYTAFCQHYSYDSGKTSMQEFLQTHSVNDIDAVFCGDDLICMGAIDAVTQHGYNVPDDIGFIGFNDINIGQWGKFKLTTIHQPIREITLNAVDIILSSLEQPTQPITQTRLFPCRLITRDTL